MSKRRATSPPNAHKDVLISPPIDESSNAYKPQQVSPQRTSARLTNVQEDILRNAIVEAGGPFWDKIMAMHGSNGSLSNNFAGFKPHELWRRTCEMYCDLIDSTPDGESLPVWAQLASKSLSMNIGGSGIREREVIKAAYDAYNWTSSEDDAILKILEEVRSPTWSKIYEQFRNTFPSTSRSMKAIEHRAIVLHRFYSYFHPLSIPPSLEYLRTPEVNSFGVPWNIAWTEDEDAKLLDGINKMRGPYWGKILGMYGSSGINGNQLAGKAETDLAQRAREWWTASSGQQKHHIHPSVLEVLQYIQPKGFTTTGMPTSRGWSEEQDEILISELELLQTPNYNEILIRHGVNGRVSQKLAPKNYAQLRGRALKLYDFCIREKREMPKGLQFAKRKE